VFVTRLDLGNNVLGYSTFLGGAQDDQGLGLAVDGLGNAYVTGFTTSSDFPVQNAIQSTKGADGCATAPCADAFAVQLAASGSELVYATYLGGSGEDFGLGLALDAASSAYLTGYTFSPDFPTTWVPPASPRTPASPPTPPPTPASPAGSSFPTTP